MGRVCHPLPASKIPKIEKCKVTVKQMKQLSKAAGKVRLNPWQPDGNSHRPIHENLERRVELLAGDLRTEVEQAFLAIWSKVWTSTGHRWDIFHWTHKKGSTFLQRGSRQHLSVGPLAGRHDASALPYRAAGGQMGGWHTGSFQFRGPSSIKWVRNQGPNTDQLGLVLFSWRTYLHICMLKRMYLYIYT